jgi:hypothetical protein
LQVASTEIIDRRTPNAEVCMAYGYSAMVFDQRVFVTYNPFNLYVTQVRGGWEFGAWGQVRAWLCILLAALSGPASNVMHSVSVPACLPNCLTALCNTSLPFRSAAEVKPWCILRA